MMLLIMSKLEISLSTLPSCGFEIARTVNTSMCLGGGRTEYQLCLRSFPTSMSLRGAFEVGGSFVGCANGQTSSQKQMANAHSPMNSKIFAHAVRGLSSSDGNANTLSAVFGGVPDNRRRGTVVDTSGKLNCREQSPVEKSKA